MRILGYVDPGSGLVVLQILTAAVSGVLFTFKRFRTWVLRPFRKKTVKKTPPPGPARGLETAPPLPQNPLLSKTEAKHPSAAIPPSIPT
jgi:hypothetical protein